MSNRCFADNAGFTRHCWECVHSSDWRAMRGWCEAYEMTVTRQNTPDEHLDKVAGCEHYDRRD